MLKKEILKYANKQDWKVLEIIYESEHKKTAILKIVFCGQICIAKVCLPGAPVHIVAAFVTETKYYMDFSDVSGIPRLVAKGKNFLIIEFVDGESIWNYFQHTPLTNNEILTIAEEIAKKIYQFNSVPNKNIEKINTFNVSLILFGRLKDLFFSGPKGTKYGVHTKIKLKAIYYISLPILIIAFIWHIRKIIIDNRFLGNRYHGDLHMNNFLIDSCSKVYLIDFECTREEKLMFVDFVYSYATLSAISPNNPKIKILFKQILLGEKESIYSFDYILNVFESVAKMNSRFVGNKIGQINKNDYFKSLLGL